MFWFWVIMFAAFVLASLAAKEGGCGAAVIILVIGGIIGAIFGVDRSKPAAEVVAVADTPQQPPKPESSPPPEKSTKSFSFSWKRGEQPKIEKKVEPATKVEPKAEQPKVEVKKASVETPVTQPVVVVAPIEPERPFTMPDVHDLFVVGGAIFWLLLAAELIGLYFLVEYEKGLYAGGLLIAFVVSLFIFSNITFFGTVALIQAHRPTFYGGIAAYFVIGVIWMFARWTWLGLARRDRYTALRDEWLSERGVPKGGKIPDHLLEEWQIHVKGDPGGIDFQELLRNARREWIRAKLGVPAASPTEDDYVGRGVRGRRDPAPTVTYPEDVPAEHALEWTNFCVHDVLGDQPGASLMSQARKLWLRDVGVFDGGESPIPNEYKEWFKRRITPTHFSPRSGHTELKELSEKPTAWKRIGRLTRWLAWWPLDMVVFFLHDFLYRAGKFLVYRCRAVLQGIMDRIYAPIAEDFRAPSDRD